MYCQTCTNNQNGKRIPRNSFGKGILVEQTLVTNGTESSDGKEWFLSRKNLVNGKAFDVVPTNRKFQDWSFFVLVLRKPRWKPFVQKALTYRTWSFEALVAATCGLPRVMQSRCRLQLEFLKAWASIFTPTSVIGLLARDKTFRFICWVGNACSKLLTPLSVTRL